tara:strand:+ start:146 stop:1006 length:861 start_codon:yes stop_codon:yes gene_type:complete
MQKRFLLVATTLLLTFLHNAGYAMAEGVEMRSEPWQLFFQKPMSPSAEKIYDFNVFLLWIEGLITVFVLGLMAYICFKFAAKKNPTPSKTTHNALLEVLWTGIPVIILIVIAIPSLKILYFTDKIQTAEMTLKITGNQWYWTYEYPDHDGLTFDSNMLADEELKSSQPRLLSVDNPVVLPANTKIRLLMGSNDVMHNWAMPSLAIKVDTVPGRINETWTQINQVGDYYGQCSELCGINHGFMPIHIKALKKEAFEKWVVKAKKEFALNPESSGKEQLRLAGNIPRK